MAKSSSRVRINFLTICSWACLGLSLLVLLILWREVFHTSNPPTLLRPACLLFALALNFIGGAISFVRDELADIRKEIAARAERQ